MSRPVRVLVVDDVPELVDALVDILADEDGIEVVGTAVDGADALSRAGELEPDVVLMDVRMPTLDGIEATRALAGRRTKVVLLSAYGDESLVEEGLAAGASRYVLKGCPSEDIVRAIRSRGRRGTT